MRFALLLLSSSALAAPFVEGPSCFAPVWQPGGQLVACTVEEMGDRSTRAGIALVGLDGKERAFVLGPTGLASFSPDGRRVAAPERRVGEGPIFVFDSDGKNGVLVEVGKQIWGAVAWLPDGSGFLFAHAALFAAGRTDISQRRPFSTANFNIDTCAGCSHVDVSRDGKIAFVKLPLEISVMDDKRLLRSVAGPGDTKPYNPEDPVSALRWSPDGRWLLVATSDKDGSVFDIADDSLPKLALRRIARGRDFAWSPDSRELAVVSGDKIAAIRLSDGKSRPLIAAEAGCQFLRPAWSPAGLAVMVGCAGKPVRLRIYQVPR